MATSIICSPQTLSTLRGIISEARARSAWSRGVNAYALDILDNLEYIANYHYDIYEEFPPLSESLALNGADNWQHYAAGGCGLVYTSAILERLCTPSELRRLGRSGRCDIDAIAIEARALFQAWRVIVLACSNLA